MAPVWLFVKGFPKRTPGSHLREFASYYKNPGEPEASVNMRERYAYMRFHDDDSTERFLNFAVPEAEQYLGWTLRVEHARQHVLADGRNKRPRHTEKIAGLKEDVTASTTPAESAESSRRTTPRAVPLPGAAEPSPENNREEVDAIDAEVDRMSVASIPDTDFGDVHCTVPIRLPAPLDGDGDVDMTSPPTRLPPLPREPPVPQSPVTQFLARVEDQAQKLQYQGYVHVALPGLQPEPGAMPWSLHSANAYTGGSYAYTFGHAGYPYGMPSMTWPGNAVQFISQQSMAPMVAYNLLCDMGVQHHLVQMSAHSPTRATAVGLTREDAYLHLAKLGGRAQGWTVSDVSPVLHVLIMGVNTDDRKKLVEAVSSMGSRVIAHAVEPKLTAGLALASVPRKRAIDGSGRQDHETKAVDLELVSESGEKTPAASPTRVRAVDKPRLHDIGTRRHIKVGTGSGAELTDSEYGLSDLGPRVIMFDWSTLPAANASAVSADSEFTGPSEEGEGAGISEEGHGCEDARVQIPALEGPEEGPEERPEYVPSLCPRSHVVNVLKICSPSVVPFVKQVSERTAEAFGGKALSEIQVEDILNLLPKGFDRKDWEHATIPPNTKKALFELGIKKASNLAMLESLTEDQYRSFRSSYAKDVLASANSG